MHFADFPHVKRSPRKIYAQQVMEGSDSEDNGEGDEDDDDGISSKVALESPTQEEGISQG
jgi:hypothetical protein